MQSCKYRLVEYVYGKVIGTLDTDDYEAAKRFYKRNIAGNSCVRVYVNDKPLRIAAAETYFEFSSWKKY